MRWLSACGGDGCLTSCITIAISIDRSAETRRDDEVIVLGSRYSQKPYIDMIFLKSLHCYCF